MKMLASHTNSERETLSVQRCEAGQFEGQLLLVIHDDEWPSGSGKLAPMLLDAGTMRWLAEQMATLSDEVDA